MTVPRVYRKSRENIIQSFNYTDIADGTGVLTFYGANTKQITTKTYILTNQIIYSNDILTESTAVTTEPYTKKLDLDFDLSEFNIPKDIIGTAIITGTLKGYKNSSNMEYYCIGKIRHWDGTNETTIGTAQSEIFSINDQTTYNTITVKIPITSLVHFTKGDTLRVTMEVWAQAGSGSGNVSLYHDPMNRANGTADTTQLRINIPFKINL